MLGITTYQESLRALGAHLDRERQREASDQAPSVTPQTAELPAHLVIEEQPSHAEVQIRLGEQPRTLDAEQLEQILLRSRARRGVDPAPAGPLSDLLRSVGLALDELRAISIGIDLTPAGVAISFAVDDAPDQIRTLTYAGEELAALRQSAAARRKGDPLRRVLILHADARKAAAMREILVAEFAVQALPSSYAPAVARAGESPDMVVMHAGDGASATRTLDAIRELRASERTVHVPILVVAPTDANLAPDTFFAGGADDVMGEPFAPAMFRARLRTWMLRGRSTAAELAAVPALS